MSDVDERVRMSVDEIALMREIVKWRRSNGIDFVRRIAVYGSPYWKDYRTGREVWVLPGGEPPLSVVAGGEEWSQTMPACTFTQAVDMLVALGYLPPRFSAAYRAGWDAREEATDADGCLDLLTWGHLNPAVQA